MGKAALIWDRLEMSKRKKVRSKEFLLIHFSGKREDIYLFFFHGKFFQICLLDLTLGSLRRGKEDL